MKHALIPSLALAAVLLTPDARSQEQGMTCGALADLELAGTTFNTATLVPAGRFNPREDGEGSASMVPSFCRVDLTVDPAIDIEVWLPLAENWNGRYKAVGGGGLAGSISYNAMLPSIRDHYVTSSTDTGHEAGELEWLSDIGRMRDYGYRAIHEMALKTKELIDAFYGRPADYAYFNGCSTGGRQGLMEAQRFPEDFDGIVSGAPVNYFVATHYTQLWITAVSKPLDSTILPPEDLAMVTEAVLEQCDAIDGVEDGILEDPRQCDFEPSSLQCEGRKNGSSCLSAQQVSAMENIYQGPVDPQTGGRLHYSLMPGGENPQGPAGWTLVRGSGLFNIPREFFARSVFQDPDWNWRTFDFGSDIDLAMRRTGNILEATSPNLDAFQARDGKLILYHGWNDPVIFPEGTIAYYQSIVDNLAMTDPDLAQEATTEFARLFMVPGMSHCGGGPGTDQFNMQSAIEAWVEDGQAPDSIRAVNMADGEVIRSRPLCPFPETARYDGSGDINDIGNFSCSAGTGQ